MLGTYFNAATILLGAIIGLSTRRQFSAAAQNYIKLILGCVTIFYGMKLAWTGLNGTFWSVTRQFTIALLALMLGRLIGRFLHLQKLSNRLGRQARDDIARTAGHTPSWTEGFNTCSALFCATPLAVIGCAADGLGAIPAPGWFGTGYQGYFQPLLIKAVIDGLAAYGFVSMFRWSVLLSAIPVFVYQGTLTLLCIRYAKPFLESRALLDSVITTDGLLLVFISLVIFEVRKIELADYLPALALAPLITSLWH